MKRLDLPFWREPNVWRLIGLALLMASAFWPSDLHVSFGSFAITTNVPAIIGSSLLGWPMLREITIRVLKWKNGQNS